MNEVKWKKSGKRLFFFFLGRTPRRQYTIFVWNTGFGTFYVNKSAKWCCPSIFAVFVIPKNCNNRIRELMWVYRCILHVTPYVRVYVDYTNGQDGETRFTVSCTRVQIF